MKERPILFSAPMVRALLAGTKTQTRRIVNPQPAHGVGRYTQDGAPGEVDWVLLDEDGDPCDSQLRCPYGAPGDRLWVRETSCAEELSSGQDGVTYVADNAFRPIENTKEAAERWLHMNNYAGRRDSLVPSIHMPRWASRLTLEVTDVRVERVQDISEEDAVAEGIEVCWDGDATLLYGPHGCYTVEARDEFRRLWSSINGAESWAANPWVWVVGFKVVT